MTDPSSTPLLERVAAGDMAAIQSCIDEYGGLVWSLARRFLPVAADAEDAVQEVFVALWENSSRYDRTKGAEVTFVAMIARRRLIDRARQHERRERLVNEVKERVDHEPRSEESPVAKVDEAQRAMDAMEKLSEPQQRVLRLAIHRGLTHEQIATVTKLPLGTVKTHTRRGLQRIRELLGGNPSDEPARSGP